MASIISKTSYLISKSIVLARYFSQNFFVLEKQKNHSLEQKKICLYILGDESINPV